MHEMSIAQFHFDFTTVPYEPTPIKHTRYTVSGYSTVVYAYIYDTHVNKSAALTGCRV